MNSAAINVTETRISTPKNEVLKFIHSEKADTQFQTIVCCELISIDAEGCGLISGTMANSNSRPMASGVLFLNIEIKVLY
jgi:hypothetical protein